MHKFSFNLCLVLLFIAISPAAVYADSTDMERSLRALADKAKTACEKIDSVNAAKEPATRAARAKKDDDSIAHAVKLVDESFSKIESITENIKSINDLELLKELKDAVADTANQANELDKQKKFVTEEAKGLLPKSAEAFTAADFDRLSEKLGLAKNAVDDAIKRVAGGK